CPNAGERKGEQQHSLFALGQAAAQLPQGERAEQRCGQRMCPEGDQCFHDSSGPGLIVRFADMRWGVAILYKYKVNAVPSAMLIFGAGTGLPSRALYPA